MLDEYSGFHKTKHYTLVSLVLILSVLFTVSAVSQEITRGGKRLIIRGDKNYPPYEFIENGKPTGFNVELILAVTEVMGLEAEILLGNWDEVRNDLETGRIDAITSMVYSRERDRYFDFSAPHFIASQAIFVRKESPIKSLNDIKDKEIIVQKGDIMHEYVIENNLSTGIIPVDDQTDALRLLASGKHDCALLSKLVGLYNIRKLNINNIKTVGPPILQLEYCFVVAEGNSVLLSQLNEGLSIIKETGKFKEIHDRWFGQYLKQYYFMTVLKHVALILVPLLFLLLVVLGWSWSLRNQVNKRTDELRKELEERKKIEMSLRESEEQFRSVFNTYFEGIFIYNKGIILEVNRTTASILGYEPEELKNFKVLNIVTEESREDIGKKISAAMENPDIVLGPFETVALRKDGTTFPAEVFSKRFNYHGVPARLVAFRDITERVKAQELLVEGEKRLRRMNEVLVSIASKKTVISGNLDAAFREITEAAANTLEVESSSIWLFNKDEGYSCCNDLFLRDKGKHHKGFKIESSKFESSEEIFQNFKESRLIALSDISSDRYLKEVYDHYFFDSGVTSTIKAQIRSGGETTGVLSIDHAGPPRSWTIDERNFAGSLADIVSIAMETSERMKAEKELENKIALESLISQIASKFMHISPFEIDIGINHALRRVGEFEGIDRIYVYTFNEDVTRMNNTHEWCGDGIEPEIQNLQNLDTSQFPWWIGKLKKLEIIYIPSVDELPEDAKIEKEILQSFNVKSELVVPMEYHNSLYGYIGFDKVNTEKKWTEDSILVLEQVGRIIVNALEHKRLHEELRKANEDLERKVEERTRELRQKQAQLVQSEKMASLGNLVAGVAHEINTPLGALKSNNDIFIRSIKKMKNILSDVTGPEDSPKDPDLAKLFTSIEKLNEVNKTASERIVNIVNSLRTFARLDKAEMDTVDIHEGIESTLTLVHHELKRRIDVHKDYGNIPKISCYPNQLNQVFMNILVNAGQAIEDKGDIFIRTYTKSNKAIIEIKDTGKGIPEESLNRIFDPGYTTKSKGVGTGLGLSIVYQIIENHNGSIEVESEVGKGTLFRIILPL